MADPQRTPRTISEDYSAGRTDVVTNGPAPVHPEQQPWPPGTGAPAGPFFSASELPVVSVIGGPPARLGGYSPDPAPTPQTATMEDPRGLQHYKAPQGIAR